MTSTASHVRRRFMDRFAAWTVTAGGLAIIASVLGIFLFILGEVAPLLKSPTVESPRTTTIPDAPLFVGCDEYDDVGYVVLPNGTIRFLALGDGTPRGQFVPTALNGNRVTAVYQRLNDLVLNLATEDGRVVPVTLVFDVTFRDDPTNPIRQLRTVTPSAIESPAITLDTESRAITSLTRRDTTGGVMAFAAVTQDGRAIWLRLLEKKTMAGTVKREEQRATLDVAKPAAVALERGLQDLFIATTEGRIVHVDVREPEAPRTVRSVDAARGPITALTFLNGDVSLIVGDATGRVGVWFLTNAPEGGEKVLTHIRDVESHLSQVTSIWPSIRDKGFITADRDGAVKLHYSTSDQTFLTLKGASSPVRQAFFSPRSTSALSLHENGALHQWHIENPHPETTLGTLFGPVWYESYDKPDWVWQSTGGTDDFEPKFSLWPLMFGTIKGTVYALFIGIPVALVGALFTSQFLHPRIRGVVKPVIEIMAALPSVVLGFLAGLWLAPYMERIVPAIITMFIVVPAFCILAMFAWNLTSRAFRTKWREKLEIVFILVAVCVGVWLCLQVNAVVEHAFFRGDFPQWWFSTTGLKYDQRNALVVGFAMGFAVIPIIFTISEDSLANVPRHLTSGSLALGATRWQTALRVVLPTASPGIFSAVLVGFGRAVGETMIVLMATGNTPIMEWNIFNGFRTLSANIAVEIPEAAQGETLYRTLFLAALLLFLCTFLVNTAAEVIRIRMRKRYAQL